MMIEQWQLNLIGETKAGGKRNRRTVKKTWNNVTADILKEQKV